MATTTQIPVEEYLTTSYRPDCDYVDGEVQERNLGEFEHASLQGKLIIWFGTRENEWQIRVLPEQRLQVKPRNYRVPDVMVLRRDQPVEKIFTRPPLLIVEVLSSEDRMSRVRRVVDDYLSMGVEHVWLLDPLQREAFRCTANGFEKSGDLKIPGSPIHLSLTEIFSALD
jgi:Uma2 family endonuclease